LEERTEALPEAFSLAQNYPNPFNSETVFRYALPRRSTVVLDVFNLAGQRVARLVYGVREPGLHTVGWDGRDDADRELATGIYVARLRADRKTSSRKVMLVR
jgi:hypothetical protein